MPHRIISAYENEHVTVTAPVITSFAFYYGDQVCFVLNKETDYFPLRRKMFVLYQITEFEPINEDLYKCIIVGTDGSRVRMHFTTEAVLANMNLVSEKLEMEVYS